MMILTCSVHALTTVVDVLRGLCALDCTRGHVEAIVEWRGAGRAGGRIDRRVPPQTGSSGARDCNSFLKGLSEKVPISDTHRDLTARQGAHTPCHCTHSKATSMHDSHEAHKRCTLPHNMPINEQCPPRSIVPQLPYGECHALSMLL